jgi:hypothetical protein
LDRGQRRVYRHGVVDPLAARVSSHPPTELAPAERPWLSGAVVVTLACALLVVNARTFMPFLSDDAFISLRYAHRLIEGHGLTWNPGERVEGYSNLLWTLLAAGAGALGANLVWAVRVMGVLSSFATIGAIVYAHPPRRFVDVLPALMAACLLAISGPVAVWSIGGLEQPLVGALLAWALVLTYPLLDDEPRRHVWLAPSILLSLLCWTRADGALFTAAIAGGLVLARGITRASLALAARLVALPIVAVAADIAFRLLYYHDWLPNSAVREGRVHGVAIAHGSRLRRLGPRLARAAGRAGRRRSCRGMARYGRARAVRVCSRCRSWSGSRTWRRSAATSFPRTGSSCAPP